MFNKKIKQACELKYEWSLKIIEIQGWRGSSAGATLQEELG